MATGVHIEHSGITRLVIILDEVVIKIARPDDGDRLKDNHGRRANLMEASLSPKHPDKLCPVQWCEKSGSVLIMTKARPMTNAEFNEMDQTWFSKFRRGLPIEMKASSLGWLDGRIVAIDYGG